MGTIVAKHKPLVILTSNRTRELSDALKRRCLYHWVHYPDMEKEVSIVQKHLPEIDQQLNRQLVELVNVLRSKKLDKSPGIAETLDWAKGLLALGYQEMSIEAIAKSLGCVLKSETDLAKVRAEGIENLLAHG